MPTKPTCVKTKDNPDGCWDIAPVDWNDASSELYFYRDVRGADADYFDEWNQDWQFCPYCGAKAEEEE